MLRAIARGAPGTEWRRIYSIKSPVAGADLTIPMPTARAWQLLAVSCTFTASAAAGNRLPALTMQDSDGTPLARIACPTAITANLAPVVTWTPGVGAAFVVPASSAVLPLPNAWYMMPQESLKITGHTDAGDTITKVRLTVLELNTGDVAYEGAIERRILDHVDAIRDLAGG